MHYFIINVRFVLVDVLNLCLFKKIAKSNSYILVIENREHGEQKTCGKVKPHSKKCEDR
jgi:hypothetical protein